MGSASDAGWYWHPPWRQKVSPAQQGGRAWWQVLRTKWLCEMSRKARNPGKWKREQELPRARTHPQTFTQSPLCPAAVLRQELQLLKLTHILQDKALSLTPICFFVFSHPLLYFCFLIQTVLITSDAFPHLPRGDQPSRKQDFCSSHVSSHWFVWWVEIKSRLLVY